MLREVFEVDYEQVAAAIGKSEASARQIVHRAKQRLKKVRGADREHARTPPQEQYAILRRLIQTAIGDPLARLLIGGQVTDGQRVVVDRGDDGLTLTPGT